MNGFTKKYESLDLLEKYCLFDCNCEVDCYNCKIQEVIRNWNGFILSKNPSLEEVKQEWEELGYEWIDKNDGLINIKHKKDVAKDILIYTSSKNYISIWTISFQEHQLLTKTFRALGWLE